MRVKVVSLFILAICRVGLAGSVWNVALTSDKTGKVLMVSNACLNVSLAENVYWTIREIRAGGTLLVGARGANGAVANVKPAARQPEAKDGWMGTGHGRETINSYTIALDGKIVDLKPGESVSGRAIKLTKASNIGPLDQVAVIAFQETGDRLMETTSFTANRKLSESLSFVYAYMHCNANTLTEWRAWLNTTDVLDGTCAKDDRSNALMQNIRAVALFGADIGTGLIYVYPEVYLGGAKSNFFWDRQHDNKLYFRPKIPGVINEAGETCTYQLTVIPFKATATEWKEAVDKIIADISKNGDF